VLEGGGDLLVALGDLVLAELIGRTRLPEFKEVVWVPGAFEAGEESFFFVAEDPGIAEFGQGAGGAFAGEDGVEEAQAADAVELAEDAVEVEVHLVARALHLLDVFGPLVDEFAAAPAVGAQRPDGFGGDEAGLEEAVAVEHGVPFAVLDVALAPGEVARVGAVEEGDVEAGLLERIEERQPVDPGGFHRDTLDLVGLQIGAERVQIRGEGGEVAHRLAGRGDEVLFGPDINGGDAREDVIDGRGGPHFVFARRRAAGSG
jgi:hypothetical protein